MIPAARLMPGWLLQYRRADLPSDLLAGLLVAGMLVPQAMAYAALAGLPPQAGLYASVLPLLIYAWLGTSPSLSVGPVAIVSLMVAAAASQVAAPGSAEYQQAALVLALLSGGVLILMGFLRMGFIVNFLGHPVVSGFTSAAALLIILSQLPALLGVDAVRGHGAWETLRAIVVQLPRGDPATVVLSAIVLAVLFAAAGRLRHRLGALGLSPAGVDTTARAAPLGVIVVTTFAAWLLDLGASTGIRIVGAIPAGLPPLTLPALDHALWRELAPAAVLIALVGFLESVSVARALALRRRERIDPDRELHALGAANLGAAFTGGYPVTGGISRSLVNHGAGARTPMASVITAAAVLLTLLVLTPMFHHLPRAVLAAIIVVAAIGLVDTSAVRNTWRYDRADTAALAATFLGVLSLGIETGIMLGVGVALALHLWRSSRPHMAEIGRVGDSEHFRNVRRFEVRTDPHILAVRVDESLWFANAGYLEHRLLTWLGDRPGVRHLVLVMSAVNAVDGSALETLEQLADELGEAGITLHLAEVKGPVMDRLAKSDLLSRIQPGRIFLSTHEAMVALGGSRS